MIQFRLGNILTLCSLLLCSSYTLKAQIMFVDEEKFQLRISHIDEFTHRMNLEKDYTGQIITADTDTVKLKKTLATLFNMDSIGCAYTEQTALQLTDTLLTRRHYLKLTDSTVYVRVDCEATYKRKETELSLVLRMDTLGNGNKKWYLADACGAFTEWMIADSTVYLSPAMHGTNFMSMPNILKLNKELLPCYAGNTYRQDRLSMLFAWLYDGSIEIKRIKSVEYVLIHIPNYIITVRRNDNLRDTTSGWQIVQIKKN